MPSDVAAPAPGADRRRPEAERRPTLLFVVNEAGEFTELSRVARAAKDAYQCAFLFASSHYQNLGKDRATCRLEGFAAFWPGRKLRESRAATRAVSREEALQDGYLPYSMTAEGRRARENGGLKRGLAVLALGTFYVLDRLNPFKRWLKPRERQTAAGYYVEAGYARQVYAHVRPTLVVFGQEFPGSINTVITQLAKRDGVRTMIVPFAMGTTKEMVESLHDKPQYEAGYSLVNRIAAQLYPHWVNYYRGRELLRMQGSAILLLEALKLAPEHPWVPNWSRVDVIAVESPEMLDYYRRMQFPPQQLRLTGATSDDMLHAGLAAAARTRRILERDLKLPPRKKLLVCAWPTNQFGSRFIPLEFSNYEQLCNAWAAALGKVMRDGVYEVVICPHPVTPRELLEAVLRPHKLNKRVYHGGTAALVPCADLFVACVSSTIRWAIASGVPVINYDCYDYGYTDFDPAPGVRTVRGYGEFDRQLQQWTETAEALDPVRAAQLSVADRWAMRDGQSAARLLALIGEQVQSARRSSPDAGAEAIAAQKA